MRLQGEKNQFRDTLIEVLRRVRHNPWSIA
jgi:hypothetical protein